ncbi:MAG: PAS domain S-box protein [Phenylobacterium sp.]|uniref:PAS domain S-box protein n=1 Tax=Phenylobacterium sp. TaxID=1871053 RepID=UPI0027244DBB|nr:PAS domain S-box protein [Phenylobacterium sp.]MDO8901145.1 PAS domain S-box protein [Phenylobacterium sp.]
MSHAQSAEQAGAQLSMAAYMFQQSLELMFVAKPDGRLTLVNEAWTRATGWRSEELIGRHILDLIHPEEADGYGAHASRLLNGKVSQTLARFSTKDGQWRWLAGRCHMTPEGLIIGVLWDAANDRARQAELEEARRTRLLLSEAAGIGAWSYEPATGEVIWSEELQGITGRRADEVRKADDYFTLLHPEERDAVQAAFQRGVREGVSGEMRHRLQMRDGGWTYWRTNFHCEPRSGGLFALKGISQELTELIAARDQARASARQMAQLIENAPFAVAMFDRDMRHMVASPRWREVFEIEAERHIGETLRAVCPGLPRRFLSADRQVLAGQAVGRSEDRFVDGRGNRRWIRWDARPWYDAAGAVGGMVAYLDDISDLAQAREAARANARRLKVSLAAADAGVYEIDHRARTFWASPEFKKLFGSAKASYEDAQHLRFPRFHPDDLEQVRQAFRDIHQGAQTSGEAFEARVLAPDGEARWVRVFHHLQKDAQGRWLKGVGLVHDFDERKRQELALVEAERAAQAGAEAKAQFLANMSHEIRTPMNGVLGVLHLLKAESLSPDGRRMLEEALSCGQMLAELLNDVIDISRIEAGRLDLAYEALDPAALAEGVASLLAPQAQERGLEITVQCAPNLGWRLGEPTRLRQALFNLVGNAVKFTLRGHVQVRASLTGPPEAPRLRFEVEDSGVGIPLEVQPRIFQRFDQGDASTTRQFGGSGLGLTITQRLAELMGGEVGFRSVPGVGSTFWLEVPADAAQAPIPSAPAAAPQDVLGGLRILVVEDNPTNRMIAIRLLESLGAKVETAADGYLGVEAATRGGHDLVLMDVQMPGIDGVEATRRIRALPGPERETPIIALTANVMSHQRQAYEAAGMDGVVGKPISPAMLLAEIARLGTQTAASGEPAEP